MTPEYEDFAARFANSVIAKDFAAAHALLAPWLQEILTDDDLRAVIENYLLEINEYWEITELIYPTEFQISGNSSTLAFLREDPGWRPPRDISP